MLEVLMSTDDVKVVYCAPTSDMLLGNSLPMLKKLIKRQTQEKKPSILSNLVVMASAKSQSLHEESFKFFADYLLENKALKYFLDGFEEGGSGAFSDSINFDHLVFLIKQC